jgi:hypothetical protein
MVIVDVSLSPGLIYLGDAHDGIKYAAYRTAVKLRDLQVYTKRTYSGNLGPYLFFSLFQPVETILRGYSLISDGLVGKIPLSTIPNAFYALNLNPDNVRLLVHLPYLRIQPEEHSISADDMSAVLLEVLSRVPNAHSFVDVIISWMFRIYDKYGLLP